MKRSLLLLTKILLFIVGFAVSLYIFIPWQEAGKFAMSFASRQLQSRGMRLNYSDVAGESGGFTVNNLTLSGMADISLSSVTIIPDITASALNLSPVCSVRFRGLNIRLGQTMNFGDGGFLVTAGREVILENLRTNGDFRLNGYMTINTATMKIGQADARFDVPESFSANMNMMKNFLPLVQEGDRWYLRRK